MWSLHHKKAGALSVESSHFDKPGDKKERERIEETKNERRRGKRKERWIGRAKTVIWHTEGKRGREE